MDKFTTLKGKLQGTVLLTYLHKT